MENLKLLYHRLRKTLKFSITNPKTFKEILTFKSNLIRVFSLSFIILLLTALVSIFFVGGFDYFFSSDSVSITRNKLEKQSEKIADLYSKIESQQSYINNIKSILNNKIQGQHNIDTLEEKTIEIDISKMHSKQTVPEKNISEKVKQDMSTNLSIKNNSIVRHLIKKIKIKNLSFPQYYLQVDGEKILINESEIVISIIKKKLKIIIPKN